MSQPDRQTNVIQVLHMHGRITQMAARHAADESAFAFSSAHSFRLFSLRQILKPNLKRMLRISASSTLDRSQIQVRQQIMRVYTRWTT